MSELKQSMDQLLKTRKLMVVLGMIIMLAGSTAFAWGVFVSPLMELHGWEKTDVAYVGNVEFAFYCLGVFFAGLLQKKINSRKVLTIGAICVAGGLALSAVVTTPIMMYITYGVLLGTGVGLVYSIAMFNNGIWWPDAKAFAMACTLCIWGGAPAFLSPILVKLVASYGVTRLFLGEAVFFAIVLLICAALFRDAPAGFNPHPEKVAVAPSNQRNYYLHQAVRTWPFWAHFIAMAIYPGLYMCMNSLLVVYGTDNGMSTSMASLIVTAVALAQLIARFAWGPLEDKIGWKKGYITHTIIFLLGGVVLLMAKGSPVIIFAGGLLMGGGFGAVSVSNPVIGLECWGPKATASVFGVCLLGYAPANLIVPRVGYALLNSTGSYTPLIIFGMVCTVIGACSALSIKPIDPNKFTEEE